MFFEEKKVEMVEPESALRGRKEPILGEAFHSINGRPLNLSIPEVVRSGDIVQLDASGTIDPEGGPMKFSWDLNFLEDSNGDSDPRNDVDSTEELVYLPTETSGTITGSLTVDDGL